jgi:hypothetical protein
MDLLIDDKVEHDWLSDDELYFSESDDDTVDEIKAMAQIFHLGLNLNSFVFLFFG